MKHPHGARRRSWIAAAALLAGAALLVQCRSSEPERAAVHDSATPDWDVVYAVLQHPRCMNCHPAGDRPLQGDRSIAHAQNVQRGPDGHGIYALRCDACHQTRNLDGLHMPPGAPTWHLPSPEMPLVFEGRSSGELCRQLKDPAQNGGRTTEQIFEHMAHDALVLWGWNPGPGRAPVPTAHQELVRSLRAWIDGGCGCPP